MSFYVDDVDAAPSTSSRTARPSSPDTRSSVGVEILFLADPDGVRVELMALRRAVLTLMADVELSDDHERFRRDVADVARRRTWSASTRS